MARVPHGPQRKGSTLLNQEHRSNAFWKAMAAVVLTGYAAIALFMVFGTIYLLLA